MTVCTITHRRGYTLVHALVNGRYQVEDWSSADEPVDSHVYDTLSAAMDDAVDTVECAARGGR